MQKIRLSVLWLVVVGFALVLSGPGPVLAGVEVYYRYPLADFSGPMKTFQARLAVAGKSNEVFAFDYSQKDIHVFDEHGMEIFRMGDENEFAGTRDFAVNDEGGLYVLVSEFRSYRIDKYDFRGELVGKVQVQGLPEQFASLEPAFLVCRQGRLYLADANGMRIVVLDQDGKYQSGYAVLPQVSQAVATSKKNKGNTVLDMTGFNVDNHGDMYFTVASMAAAFRLSPAGQLENFGKAGSSPGQFGVVAGIAVDDLGYIYLADKLRCVVEIFDKNFRFITEFGYRGKGPANLIVPSDVAVANGNVFVSQAANLGVSVFHVQETPAGAESAPVQP